VDVSSRRSGMLKLFALVVIGVVLVTSLAVASVVAAVRYREWRSAGAHRERLSIARAAVKPGMSSAAIEKVLGEPTFVDRTISEMFKPTEATCRQQSRSSFIYQARPEPTLVIFFDEQKRVTCSETTTAFMIMHRVE
jgi:outer membrane protein assembly factor BamE (lipoprotein component of BamABCDE complex)